MVKGAFVNNMSESIILDALDGCLWEEDCDDDEGCGNEGSGNEKNKELATSFRTVSLDPSENWL